MRHDGLEYEVQQLYSIEMPITTLQCSLLVLKRGTCGLQAPLR